MQHAATSRPIVPVILSGGAGTRLWPLSRPERPKQLLSLTAPETMLELTAARVADRSRFAAPLVVASARHQAEIGTQLARAGAADATLILEPAGRNTAPAIALAALVAEPNDLLLVMPSDHVIADVAAFHAAVTKAAPHARSGRLVTFGMTPTAPETGFGYIERGAALAPGVDAAARFVEKPDLATARAYVESGRFLWNAGIFLFRAGACTDALASHAPAVLGAARAAIEGASHSRQSITPDPQAFAAAPSVSIDVAVMERAGNVAVVPASMGWSDVGSWDALYDIAAKDANGSTLAGTGGGGVLAIDGRGLLVRAEDTQVTLIDVDDLIVVATPGSVLVMRRGLSQRVREAVDALTPKETS